jgi:hypothetical protein
VAGRCDVGKEPAEYRVWRGIDRVSARLLPFRETHVVNSIYWNTADGRDSVAVWRSARGWAVCGSNPGRDKVSSARPYQPRGPLNHLHTWNRVFPGSNAAGVWSLTRPLVSDHPFPSSAEVANESELNLHLPSDSMGMSRGDLAFTVQATLVIRDLTLRVFAITRFREKKP